MTQQLIWRNDDLDFNTTAAQLQPIHALFQKYGVTHTVAVICKGLHKNPELIQYLKSTPGYDIQIHCWEHVDITEMGTSDIWYAIDSCLRVFKQCGFERPTTIYPAWNKSTPILEKCANKFGLEVSNKKMSLSGYLKGQSEGVVNFHYWAEECVDLEAALSKYVNSLKEIV